jgi:basic membrane lipoprotein Med (substrate-binding protein (PBP1-ABC) superfamily)
LFRDRSNLRAIAILAAFALTAWIGVVALAQGSSSTETPPVHATTVSSTNDDSVRESSDQGENEDADDQAENEDD